MLSKKYVMQTYHKRKCEKTLNTLSKTEVLDFICALNGENYVTKTSDTKVKLLSNLDSIYESIRRSQSFNRISGYKDSLVTFLYNDIIYTDIVSTKEFSVCEIDINELTIGLDKLTFEYTNESFNMYIEGINDYRKYFGGVLSVSKF